MKSKIISYNGSLKKISLFFIFLTHFALEIKFFLEILWALLDPTIDKVFV